MQSSPITFSRTPYLYCYWNNQYVALITRCQSTVQVISCFPDKILMTGHNQVFRNYHLLVGRWATKMPETVLSAATHKRPPLLQAVQARFWLEPTSTLPSQDHLTWGSSPCSYWEEHVQSALPSVIVENGIPYPAGRYVQHEQYLWLTVPFSRAVHGAFIKAPTKEEESLGLSKLLVQGRDYIGIPCRRKINPGRWKIL